MRRSIRPFLTDESGAVAPIYVVAASALIALAGVGYDYAQMATLDTELQNGADQAALAAASQLGGQTGAIDAAKAAAQNLVANRTIFANDGGSSALTVDATQFAFYANRPDAEAGSNAVTTDADARFVTVRFVSRRARYALTPLVGAVISPNITASATAGLGQALCKAPPIMMCNPAESTDPNFTQDYRGKGIKLVAAGGGNVGPGNFGYLDIGDNASGSAITELKRALGWETPPGDCLDTLAVTTKPGANTPVTDALNTRFDIYDNNACPNDGPNPGSCPPSVNAGKDVTRRANGNSCGTTGQGWQAPATPYRADSSGNVVGTPSAMGLPRDRCHATGNTSLCSTGVDGAIGDGNWDRATYFSVTYPGFNWQGAMSTAYGTTTPTRYQVYRWEVEHAGDSYVDSNTGVATTIGSPRVVSGSGASAVMSYRSPICSPPGVNPLTARTDRRAFPVALVNCNAASINGRTLVYPKMWLNVFLVEPSLQRSGLTSQSDVYVEIIDVNTLATNTGGATQVVRRAKPYLVK